MPVRSRMLAVLALLAAAEGVSREGVAQRPVPRTADDWLADCRDRRGDDERARSCELREMGFRPAGRPVHVDAGPNGGVAVTAWDRDSVHVRAVVQASARTDADAAALLRQVRIDLSGTALRAEGPETRRGASWWVSYEVRVPRQVDLRAETVNGPLSAQDVAGRLELETTNGPVTLTDVAGDVRARATNGPLIVTLGGTRWEGAGLDAETRNGPATLSIPEGYSARLETGTVNGPMRVDIPITLQGRIGRMTRIATTLGSGGAPVRVVTTNGPLTVRRR